MNRTLAILLISLASPAVADETWNSNYGDIIYESEFGSVAVLSFEGSHPGRRVYLYVEGLGGNYTNRGAFDGYWVAEEEGDCEPIVAIDGLESQMWGPATVYFQEQGFPSPFAAELSTCWGEDLDTIMADPIVAPEATDHGGFYPNGYYSTTDFGHVEFVCVREDVCTGFYGENGVVYLNASGPELSFSGYWAQPNSEQPCDRRNHFPNLTTSSWGRVTFDFAPGGDSWSGVWGYCDASPSSIWNGVR